MAAVRDFNDWLVVLGGTVFTAKKVHDLVFEILKKKNCSTFFVVTFLYVHMSFTEMETPAINAYVNVVSSTVTFLFFTTTRTRIINTGGSTCTSGLYHQRVTGTGFKQRIKCAT